MKKIYFAFLGLLLLLTFPVKAQVIDYKRLQSEGKVPKDFLTTSSEDYERFTDRTFSEDDERDVVKHKEKFLAKSNWQLNRLLRSGIIVYNDTITNYVREVADIVLADFPEIRDKLRFYTATHASVNAFSTDAGIIIFNTGLIAQLENEAQLAYIIAHEVVHYIKKHSIKGYIEEKVFAKELEDVEAYAKDKNLYLAKNSRSREMEFEADELGFKKFYSTTDYSREAVMGAMDVLQYSYLPLNEIEFSPSILTNSYFSVPDEYLLEKVSAISVGDDYDEDLSTHPNVQKRRKSLNRQIRKENDTDSTKHDFIISEEKFYSVRKIARYETIRRLMISRNYPRAVYDAFVMLQRNPNDAYMQKVIAGSLYGAAIYKSNYSDNPIVGDYEDIEGESQQVYYLLDELPDIWTNVIAIQYAWRLHKMYPEDRYLNTIIEHLIFNIIYEHNIQLDEFYNERKEVYLAQKDSLLNVEEVDNEEEEIGSKYDRIREKSKTSHLTLGEEEYRFAFVDMLKDQQFVDKFNEIQEEVENEEEKEKVSYENIKEKIEAEESKDKLTNYGYHLGVERAIMLDPMFLHLNQKKDEEIQFFKTEKKRQELGQLIQENSKEINLDVIMLDPWQLDVNDTEKFNETMIMKDWMTEYFNHDDLRILPFATNDVYPIMDKYDVRYLNWMGVISGRVSGLGNSKSCNYCFFYNLPLALYEFVKPNYQMVYLNTLIDLENAKTEFTYKFSLPKRAGKYRLKARIYDVLNQVKTKEKK